MEKDDEVKGKDNWYAFGEYGYDPRLVQRPSPDPKSKEQPSMSPYSVFNGNPLFFTDVFGMMPEPWIIKKTI